FLTLSLLDFFKVGMPITKINLPLDQPANQKPEQDRDSGDYSDRRDIHTKASSFSKIVRSASRRAAPPKSSNCRTPSGSMSSRSRRTASAEGGSVKPQSGATSKLKPVLARMRSRVAPGWMEVSRIRPEAPAKSN